MLHMVIWRCRRLAIVREAKEEPGDKTRAIVGVIVLAETTDQKLNLFKNSKSSTMKFSTTILALTLTAASAAEIRSESAAGRNLLSKARQLNNNNNNNYYAWIQDYSIKFDGCAAVPQFEREEGVRSNLLAKFKLCPSDSCGSCRNAGEYVVDMREFVEAYQEAKEQENEAVCESATYNCEYQCQNGQYEYNANANYQNNGNGNNNNNNNNNNNDEYCQYQCLVDQNLGYCAQDAEQEGEVNMNELAECRPMNEDQANNNNGYYNGNVQMYYVGAYCTSSGVYAGVFTDSACTKKAPKGTYEKYNYGYSLPTEPMVEPGCMSCKQQNENNNGNNNNNNNNNNGNAISEVCENLYEQAAKCEKNVKGTNYQDNSSCELIHNIIPKLNSALNSMRGRPQASKFFAWMFGIACVLMGWYIYRLHKTVIRQKVDLGTLMGGTAA